MSTKLEVPIETMAKIVQYLSTKPFNEVHVLMALVQSPDIKEIEDVSTD